MIKPVKNISICTSRVTQFWFYIKFAGREKKCQEWFLETADMLLRNDIEINNFKYTRSI